MARRRGAIKSAMVAAAMDTPGAANMPAKNRSMIREVMLRARPDPRTKMSKSGRVRRKTNLRPKVSDNGLDIEGPNARPRV